MSGEGVTSHVVIHAPGIHTGGGLAVLQALLGGFPGQDDLILLLDARVRGRVELRPNWCVQWIFPTFASRIRAEFLLWRASRRSQAVVCLHSLPPLLPISVRTVVLMQNRLLIDRSGTHVAGFRKRVRLGIERGILRLWRFNVDEYIVQTPTMGSAVVASLSAQRVHVVPVFVATCPESVNRSVPSWDFVYVSDGVPHKNHRNLVEAWVLLAEQGFKPSLALTLSDRDRALADHVAVRAAAHGLIIVDLGQLHPAEISALYSDARALIYPSILESFGLPLLEASTVGLPILAAELDFVRDVCEPVQTFDAFSPKSIARAVRRFLAQPERPVDPVPASLFWSIFSFGTAKESRPSTEKQT
jgi:glycosyltransferase involved in cell wall biosynthesis